MTDEPARPQPLALHLEAWSAVLALMRDHEVTPAWSTRLLYGWRARLFSLAWQVRPRPPAPRHELPIGLLACGFWRSGTTLLHECLALDRRWRAPTTQQCMNPGQPSRDGGQVVKRPMDNLSIASDSPQEDEFALLLLGAPSFYRALLCPTAWRDLLAELAAGAAHSSWTRRETLLREFCAWIHAGDARELLLKSPGHAFALARLLEIAPSARALVVLRDWRDVWRSCQKMWSAMFARYALAPWNAQDVAELTTAALLAYARQLPAQLQRIDPARVAVIQYEDLANAPAETLAAVYDRFGLEMSGDFPDAVRGFVADTRPAASGYAVEPGLPPAVQAELSAAHEGLNAATRPLAVLPPR